MKAETSGSRTTEGASTVKKKATESVGAAKKTAHEVKHDVQALGQKLGESGRHAIDSAQDLVGSVQDVRGQLNAALTHQASSRPYVALAAAAGLGFVLAGGLTVRLTSKLVGIGGRLLLNAAMRQLITPLTS